MILTLFLLFLSSLCRHDEGKKKKGKRSCWQRSASPARGPRCLGLVHHGRQSHLQIRRETLKECKWERKRERLREKKDREEERKVCVYGGGDITVKCMHKHTHTHIHLCLDMKTKEFNIYFLASPNLCQSVLTQFLKPFHNNFRRSKKYILNSRSIHNLTQILM